MHYKYSTYIDLKYKNDLPEDLRDAVSFGPIFYSVNKLSKNDYFSIGELNDSIRTLKYHHIFDTAFFKITKIIYELDQSAFLKSDIFDSSKSVQVDVYIVPVDPGTLETIPTARLNMKFGSYSYEQFEEFFKKHNIEIE